MIYLNEFKKISLFAIITYFLLCFSLYGGLSDPARTVTIYVHGYNYYGPGQEGIVGLDMMFGELEKFAQTVSLPVGTKEPDAPDQIAMTTFYGNKIPEPGSSYYTWEDYEEVRSLMPPLGEGGVPLYALITAKFIRHVVERSGAVGVNVMAESFGGLVSRYMIENDIEGLSSRGLFSRWITLQGAVNGAWAATDPLLWSIMELSGLTTADLEHLTYLWVRRHISNLPPGGPLSPPDCGASSFYKNMLIFNWTSTDDEPWFSALTLYTWMGNDGTLVHQDSRYLTMLERAKFMGMNPVWAHGYCSHARDPFMPPEHLSLWEYSGPFANSAAILRGSRRVTVTLDRAKLIDIHEKPALGRGEIVFESKVFSPAARELYKYKHPVCELGHEAADSPIYRFCRSQERAVNLVLFDSMVLPEENELILEISAAEIDWNLMKIYRIYEDLCNPFQQLDGASVNIDVNHENEYFLKSGDMEIKISVKIFNYPVDY